jgi:hypothetical protein
MCRCAGVVVVIGICLLPPSGAAGAGVDFKFSGLKIKPGIIRIKGNMIIYPGPEAFLLKRYPTPVTQLGISRDAEWIFVADKQGGVYVHRNHSTFENQLPLAVRGGLFFGCDFGVNGWANAFLAFRTSEIVFSPDDAGTFYSGGTVWWVKVRKTGFSEGTKLTVRGHKHPITSVAFSGNGELLATAGGKGQLPGEVRLWDVGAGKERLPRIEYTAENLVGAGDLLGLPDNFRSPPGVEHLLLSGDGSRLATTFYSTKTVELGDLKLQLWDVKTGKALRQFPLPDAEISALGMSPQGKWVAIVTNKQQGGEIALMNVETGEKQILWAPDAATVSALLFSRDGKYLVMGSSAGG